MNNSNPFDARFLEQGSGIGRTLGGVITFGGGVALYAGGKVIGGLGVSGDSACADHIVAYRMRKLAGLGGVPAGQGPGNADNIACSTGASPMGFERPHCFPTDTRALPVAHSR
ncbi:heme-binding protein [Caballeronia sp. LZ019]|nr:heme-binding protein [Caballeronia sp. LZ019]MDR5740802.1 heme-binding protein [Caballeronia sp. LZ016]MDR5808677.1 heme-binding protein [Caballeronia sp. LZ019]